MKNNRIKKVQLLFDHILNNQNQIVVALLLLAITTTGCRHQDFQTPSVVPLSTYPHSYIF